VNTHLRWLIAVVTSLMLHGVIFVLLKGVFIVDGSANMNDRQPSEQFTVNFFPSTKLQVDLVQNAESKPNTVVSFNQRQEIKQVSAIRMFSSGYLPVRELDVIPVAKREVNIYPAELINLHEKNGKVVVGLWIDESGHVVKSELIESELPAGYGEILARDFLQAEFMPGIKNGNAVKAKINVVIIYSSQSIE